MAEFYPMFFEPVLKDYIWGGRNLEKLGRDLPETGKVAESWEISGHEDGMTVVKNGTYAGKSLPELLKLLGKDLVGANNQWALERQKFPLLVKLIDAESRLSVQVHPDDDYAREHEGNELGKTEMWVILSAKPEAAIIYGLAEKTTPETLRQAIDEGVLESYLNKVFIKAGDHVCVPSGTVHAILEGALIAEIQQNSNTTYRMYDWNRVGDDGESRALHVERALDVLDFDQIGLSLDVPQEIQRKNRWVCERLCQNKYFTTDRYLMEKGSKYSGVCDGSTLEIWGVLSGEALIGGHPVQGVQFVLLPAAMGPYTIESLQNAVLLRTFAA